jgi:hypothetical protein
MPLPVVLWFRVKANGLIDRRVRMLTSLNTKPLTLSLSLYVKNKVPFEAQPLVVLNS